MSEKWKDIVGYEGLYQVSDKGRVKSVKRMVKCREGVSRVQNERIKGCSSGKYRHVMTTLWRDNEQEGVYVHRVVLEAFTGKPMYGMTGSHIDGDPTNNSIDNLVWETQKDNNARKEGHGTLQRGENHSSTSITEEDVFSIRRLHRTGHFTNVFLGRMFEVSRAVIEGIIHNKTWRHI